MVQQPDTMPGAIPTQISDDQPVTADLRTYVAAGGEVTSTDESAPFVSPPTHRKLPIRAEAEPGGTVPFAAVVETVPVSLYAARKAGRVLSSYADYAVDRLRDELRRAVSARPWAKVD